MAILDQIFANALEMESFSCPPVVPAGQVYDLQFRVKNNRAVPYRFVIAIEAPLPDGTVFRTESGGRMPMSFKRGETLDAVVPVQAPMVAVPFMDNYTAKLYLVLGIKRIPMNTLTCSTEKYPVAGGSGGNGQTGNGGGAGGNGGGGAGGNGGVTGTEFPEEKKIVVPGFNIEP